MKPEYIVEINSLVDYEYKNQKEEYVKYLDLIKKLAKQYKNDFHKVANHLENCNLEELLKCRMMTN